MNIARIAIVVSGIAAASAPAYSASPVITPIAVTGQAKPGGGAFSNFPSWEHKMSARGDLLFQEGRDLWLYSSGSLSLVARAEQIAPGTGGAKYFGGFRAAISDSGEFVFLDRLTHNDVDSPNEQALWTGTPGGQVSLFARESAGASDPLFYTVRNIAINSSGVVAFHSDGIWLASKTSPPARVMGSGAPAPGTSEEFDGTGAGMLSNAGSVVFLASTHNITRAGIWVGTPGNVELLAATDFPAPGTTGNYDLGGFGYPSISHNGRVMYTAAFKEAHGGRGIWYQEPGGLPQLLVRDGQVAPGTNDQFKGFRYPIRSNTAGTFVFSAFAGSSNFEGIWAGEPNQLSAIVTPGQRVPSMSSDITFTGAYNPMINDAGQIAFAASIAGPGIDSEYSEGIWISNPGTDPVLLIRRGDFISFGGEPHQLIDFHWPAGDVFTENFTSDGRVSFDATFSDGTSGVFIAGIPEPGFLFMVAGPMILLTHRRRAFGETTISA